MGGRSEFQLPPRLFVREKPMSSSAQRRRPEARLLVVVGVAGILCYLVIVPLVALLLGSLSTGAIGSFEDPSLHTYLSILRDRATYQLFGNSILYALGSTVLALVVGGYLAWLVQRTDVALRRAITFLTLFPLLIPSVLSAAAWVLLLDPRIGLLNQAFGPWLGFDRGPFNAYSLLGMITVRGVVDIPLAFLWLWPAFRAMDPSLDEAAAISGARPTLATLSITFPLLRPAILSAFVISFVLSLEDLTVPILIGLPARIRLFSTEIWVALGRVPRDVHSASVHGVLLLVTTILLLVAYRRVTRRAEKFAIVRGRAYRPYVLSLGRFRWPHTVGALVVLVLIGVLPVLMLVWTSLAPYVQVPSLDGLETLNLNAYLALFKDTKAIDGFKTSTLIGLGAAGAIMVMALVVGWVSVRSKMRLRGALDFIAFSPIAIPGVVLGLSLMWLYLALPVPFYGTAVILGIAYVTRFVPFGVRLTSSGFMQLHPELDEAASVSGATWLSTLRTVSVPLLAPTLVVGFTYVFLRAYLELSASLLLASYGNEPYSVVAYQFWASGEAGKTAAYGVVAILVMSAIVLSVQRLTGRSYFLDR